MKKMLYLLLISAPIFSMQDGELCKVPLKTIKLFTPHTSPQDICNVPVQYRIVGAVASYVAYEGAKYAYHRYQNRQTVNLKQDNK
jgi:hypothetical protein